MKLHWSVALLLLVVVPVGTVMALNRTKKGREALATDRKVA